MEKLTVIECVEDTENGGYKVLLSDGTTRQVKQAASIGAEWMDETPVAAGKYEFAWDPTTRELSVLLDHVEVFTGSVPLFDKALEDNAMLQRGSDDANAAMAALSTQNGKLAEEILNLKHRPAMMKAPPSLLHVHTRNVDDLPPLDALTAAETMPAPEDEVDTRTDVEKHLDAKRAAVE